MWLNTRTPVGQFKHQPRVPSRRGTRVSGAPSCLAPSLPCHTSQLPFNAHSGRGPRPRGAAGRSEALYGSWRSMSREGKGLQAPPEPFLNPFLCRLISRYCLFRFVESLLDAYGEGSLAMLVNPPKQVYCWVCKVTRSRRGSGGIVLPATSVTRFCLLFFKMAFVTRFFLLLLL